MRFGLIPDTPEEAAALEHSPHARTLLEPVLPVVAARALMGFVETGLAAALADETRSTDELAAELDLDPGVTDGLLRVMAACGYVAASPDGTGYALTPPARATLLPEGSLPLDAWIRHNTVHWRLIGDLESALRGTGDRDLHHRLETDREWATYQRAMLQTALPAAEAVAAKLPVPAGRHRLLDLGGGHGAYGAAICRRFPPMRGVVIDLPETIAHVEALAAEQGYGDILDFTSADLRDADLGNAAGDIVFMGNVIHHVDEAGLPDLLARAHRALRPGGVIAIWDLAPPPGPPADLVAESFSLLFRLSSASRCRRPEETAGVLADAGFADVDVSGGISPTHLLVTARRT